MTGGVKTQQERAQRERESEGEPERERQTEQCMEYKILFGMWKSEHALSLALSY